MAIEFINTEYVFSLYPNLITVDKPSGNIDINELIEAIKYGYVKDVVTYLRSPISKEEYNSIKKDSIPCVTLSGIFTHRAGPDLVKHSGLIQIDIDKVEDFDSVFHKLCTDEYIYVCFRSPGEKGLKAIVKINPSAKTHKSQFKSLEIYFKEHFGVSIDSQCKDLARSMLLSYDPDIYCNPMSKVYAEMYIPPEYPRSKFESAPNVAEEKIAYSDDSVEVIESIIAAIEKQHIDITSSYYNWIRIGFALCTTFGESGRDYFHRIGRLYPNYTKEETDKTYTQLLANNNGRTTLGTIIFLTKEAGIIVSRKKNKGRVDK